MTWILRLTRLTLALCVLAFVLTVGDFLALHDINHDYVSGGVLRALGASPAQGLPAWTETRGEWAMVGVSAYFRAAFLIVNGLTLALCVRRLKPVGGEA